MAFPRPPDLVPGFVKDVLGATGHGVAHDVAPAVGRGAANLATLGEYRHPGGLRAYGATQKGSFDLSDPRAAILTALMLAGRGRVEGPQRFGAVPNDRFDQAAKNMAFQRDQDALIKQMQGALGTGALARIPGSHGQLTTMQKALLNQLKFDPERMAGEPGFSFKRPRDFQNDPSTSGLIDSLGYTTGDPLMELMASMGGAYRSTNEVAARLGQNTQEIRGVLGTQGAKPFPGKPEDIFPLFQRNLSPNTRFSLPPQFPLESQAAAPFMDFLTRLMRGYNRDTGPPLR